jgi:putative transcriptional regulator
MSNKTANKTLSRLDHATAEAAMDQRRLGNTDETTPRQITLRQLGKKALPTVKPISGEEIRRVRKRENVSQAVLARYLNVTVGFVASLERGSIKTKGSTLVLLNVIRRKGLEAIFK